MVPQVCRLSFCSVAYRTSRCCAKWVRGDHNRLGHALMLCYLRYPGRPLRAGERPPESLVAFVAEQIDVLPQSIDSYRSAGRSRRSHATELQDRLRLRPFGTRPAAELASWLLPQAIG